MVEGKEVVSLGDTKETNRRRHAEVVGKLRNEKFGRKKVEFQVDMIYQWFSKYGPGPGV
jgi:hypothetical protein